MHKGKTAGLKQEIAQEEGNAPVGPAAMDEKQPLQKPELGQCKVCILHRLTSLHSCQTHTNMSRWCWGKRKEANVKTWTQMIRAHWFIFTFLYCRTTNKPLLLIILTSLAPSPMLMVTELVCFLTNVTISAFCAGVTRQHSTDWQCSARLMNVAPHSGLWSNSVWGKQHKCVDARET